MDNISFFNKIQDIRYLRSYLVGANLYANDIRNELLKYHYDMSQFNLFLNNIIQTFIDHIRLIESQHSNIFKQEGYSVIHSRSKVYQIRDIVPSNHIPFQLQKDLNRELEKIFNIIEDNLKTFINYWEIINASEGQDDDPNLEGKEI